MTPLDAIGSSLLSRDRSSNRFGQLAEILLPRYQRQDEIESYGQTANWKALNIQA
ncbi:MAG: hypothetical protein ACYTXT_20785 [Nostoc sp.]